MSGKLSEFIDRRVLVVTYDGRTILGELKGYDQTNNTVLADSLERIFSADEPVEEVPLGLYVIRGDNIAVIAEIDASLDAKLEWSRVRADPISEVRF